MIALIQKQEDFELMDVGASGYESSFRNKKDGDPAKWIERNQRILNKYQALVHTAIALEALLDAEEGK